MKVITITKEYMDTVRGFVDWFNSEFDVTDKDHQIALKRLAERLDKNEESFDIYELEIWFLRNYLQSAWQDNSCTVNNDELHRLYDYIVEKDNEQTNS